MDMDFSEIIPALPALWEGMVLTLQLMVMGVVGGIALGTVLALMRLSSSKLLANVAGAMIPASETRLLSEPWMRPCSLAGTWRVISAIVAGPATAHSALIGSPSRNMATRTMRAMARGVIRLPPRNEPVLRGCRSASARRIPQRCASSPARS